MKKLMLLSFSLLLFLSPLLVYADSNNSWYAPYDDGHNLVSQYGYYGSKYTDVTINSSTNDISFHFDNVGFNSTDYDYIELQILVSFTGYNGNESVADENIITNQYGDYIVNNDTILSFTATEMAGVWESTALCTFHPSGIVSAHNYSGILRCNVNQGSDKLTSINLKYNFINPNFGSSGKYSIFFGSTGWLNYIRKNQLGTDTIVQGQQATTNAINDMNNNINNDNVSESSSTASNFFDGFRTESNGHLTQIITAPLTLLSSMTATCSSPIEINLGFKNLNAKTQQDGASTQIGNKTISLPCGTSLFWENSELVEDISSFRTFWNILIGGPIIYGLLLLVMNAFNNALDPLNDELITLNFNRDDERMGRDMKAMEIHEAAKISHENGLHAKDYRSYIRRRFRP